MLTIAEERMTARYVGFKLKQMQRSLATMKNLSMMFKGHIQNRNHTKLFLEHSQDFKTTVYGSACKSFSDHNL